MCLFIYYVCIYVYTYVYIYMNLFTYVYTCVYVSMYVHIYICLYVSSYMVETVRKGLQEFIKLRRRRRRRRRIKNTYFDLQCNCLTSEIMINHKYIFFS